MSDSDIKPFILFWILYGAFLFGFLFFVPTTMVETEDLFVETGGLHIEKEEHYEQSFEYIEGKGTTEINTKTHTIYTVYDGNVKLVTKIIEEYKNQEHIVYFCLESDHNASGCYLPFARDSISDSASNIKFELFEIPEDKVEQEEQMTIFAS